MNSSKIESGHAFRLDMGNRQFHFNLMHRYKLDSWVEAVNLSKQTAIEKAKSISGQSKNISSIVAMHDEDNGPELLK
jgi:hypothetical protein